MGTGFVDWGCAGAISLQAGLRQTEPLSERFERRDDTTSLILGTNHNPSPGTPRSPDVQTGGVLKVKQIDTLLGRTAQPVPTFS